MCRWRQHRWQYRVCRRRSPPPPPPPPPPQLQPPGMLSGLQPPPPAGLPPPPAGPPLPGVNPLAIELGSQQFQSARPQFGLLGPGLPPLVPSPPAVPLPEVTKIVVTVPIKFRVDSSQTVGDIRRQLAAKGVCV